MANGMEISRFWASVGVKVNNSDLRKVDKLLSDIDKRFSKFKNKSGLFNFDVEKFTVNQKTLNRVLGTALDTASKTVTFEISRFAVNERNLKAALTRSSMISHIQGMNSRGSRGGVGFGGLSAIEWDRRQGALASAALLRHNRSLELANIRAGRGGVRQVGSSIGTSYAFNSERWLGHRAAEHAGYGALSGGIGRLGVGGIGAAVAGGAVLAVDRRLDQVQERVIDNDRNRILLGQSVGGSDARKTNAIAWYRDIADKYGTDAKGGITDFNTAITLQRGVGISTRQAIGNYDLFAQRFNLRHLQPHQQRGALRQITQIMGRGTVQQEDLNSLVENGDPEIKNLIKQAWAARTGYSGENISKDYQAAQKKGQVLSEDLLGAYALSAKKYAKEVEESMNSVRAAAQRLQNDKFWNQFERDGKEIEDATKDRIAAERELEEALKPLKEAMNQAEIATMGFAASTLRAAAKFTGPAWESLFAGKGKDGSSPGYFPKLSNVISNSGNVLELIGNSKDLAPKDRLSLILDAFSEKAGSMTLEDWQKKISGYGTHNLPDTNVQPLGNRNEDIPTLTDEMRTPKADKSQTTTITIGDLYIESPATNAQDFGLDLQNQLKPLLENAWSEAQLNYTKTAR